MLRRALLIWGWGHLALGDRRGWLLVLLQPLAIGGLLLSAWQLIDGTRWLAVFVPLVALIVVWVGQAVHAHRRAIALGGAPGGELQLALFLPVALAVLTAFWLIGGRHGSSASTVEAYMDAWRANRPDVAALLFSDTAAEQDIANEWQQNDAAIATSIRDGLSTYGEASGLDPARPFDSLLIEEVDVGASAGRARFVVELVRTESYETTVLGVIPTAAQRTVVVGTIVSIGLIEVTDSTGPLPALPTTTWRIEVIGALD